MAQPTVAPAIEMGSTNEDGDVLLLFYRTTHGESWRHRHGWGESATDLCNWYGVTTNKDGRVVKLELEGGEHEMAGWPRGNNIIGTIPKELGRLGALKSLHIASYKLSGTIPPELGQLWALESLRVSGALTGTIPEELCGLGALKELRISCGKLTGAIPPALGQLGALERLRLDCDNLTGTIPKELGGLGALKELELTCWKISGAIPPALGQLGVLERLVLSSHHLTGPIPPALGQLAALENLVLSCNNLTGTIPEELGGLGALKELGISCRKISGTIPPQLGKLRALEALSLMKTNLTGAIPPELGRLSALKALILSDNNLTGAIPPELGQLDALESLNLSNNELTVLGAAEGTLRLVTRLGPLQGQMFLSTFGMPSLKGIFLERNPWVLPPEGVVWKGPPAVEKYLLDFRKAEAAGAPVKVLQLLKVVLVGSSRAGKTSLVRSIVGRIGTRTSGELRDVSTKGIELHRNLINGTTVEFYDCAGQVDYYGMHQTFLTKRALYLLVWDVQKCFGKSCKTLDEVVYEDIMRWLFALHLRAPGCSVMLVANKCDGSIEDFAATAETVEKRVGELLKTWQERRKIPGKTKVTLLRHSSLVSCHDGGGLSEVTDRVASHGATSIRLPPSWGLALTFLDALRDKRAPLPAVRTYLGLEARSEETYEDASTSVFTTKAALLERWEGVVQGIEGELRSEADRMAVSDPRSAFEGAIWISDFAGQLLVVANGSLIFLDVGYLTDILKPILDHTLEDGPVPHHLAKMRDELCRNGQLRLEFARYLWNHAMQTVISDRLFDALCRVILNLGIALPLEASSLPTDGDPDPAGQNDRSRRDMLVIMRLSESCEPQQEHDLEKLISEMTHRHEREVTFKWKFDSAGPPYGLVERVIASCHVVGVVKMGLCWRYGAVFNSHAMATDGGAYRLYTFVIRYDSDFCGERRTLSLRMFGPLEDDRVWAALRWVASSVVNLSTEWRGVLWDGWPQCAQHPLERTYFATSDQARVGGLLLPDAALRRTSKACDCHSIEGTMLRSVFEHLGTVIDTRIGVLAERFCEELRVERVPGAEEKKSERKAEETSDNSKRGNTPDDSERATENNTEEPSEQRAGDEPPAPSGGRKAFDKWRPYAWQTAAALGSVAVILFSAATSVLDTEDTLWKICFGIVVLLLFGAGAAFFVFVYDFFRTGDDDEQRDGPPPDAGVP